MRERGKARERPSAYATRRPPRFRCTSSSDIAAGVTPEIRIACPDEKKFAVVQALAEELRQAGAAFNDIDGIRIGMHGGWWLLRASNTQAVLVARAEAPDASALEALKADLAARLARHGIGFAG